MLEIIPGVTEALKDLNGIFGRIVIVTNQRGIARGFMTTEDLGKVHRVLIHEIEKEGGRIDGIFFCPHASEDHCDCRKPATGLALQARDKFPEIDFSSSYIVGDSDSDMEMGNALGMISVRVGKLPGNDLHKYFFPDLKTFSDQILSQKSV
jgi:histidinol-phosphate phosphatase family protein